MTSKAKEKEKVFSKPRTNDGTRNIMNSLFLLGIVMPSKYKNLYKVYSVLINTFTIIIVPLSFSVSYFHGISTLEINHLLTSVQIAINTYACVLKFVFLAIKRRYLFKFAVILEKLDTSIKYPEQIKAARQAIRTGNRIVIIFISFYYLYSTFTFVGALSEGHPPYSLYIPGVNWRESKKMFIIASVLELVMIDIEIFQDMANDVYAVIFVGILRTHLNILHMRVRRIGTDPNCTQEDNKNELIACIHDHKNIYELIEAITPVISDTYFIQFIATVMALGITLMNITISGNDISIIMGSVAFIGALVMQLLPISFILDSLADEASQLAETIFHTTWMDQSKEFQKLCLFFMHRSQQKINFVAGKLFPISLNSFVAIMKFAFSLYTLLNNMDFGTKVEAMLKHD